MKDLELFRDCFLGSEIASVLYVDEVLDGQGNVQYIDRGISVSGSTPPQIHWDDALIDQQERSFHHGW